MYLDQLRIKKLKVQIQVDKEKQQRAEHTMKVDVKIRAKEGGPSWKCQSFP